MANDIAFDPPRGSESSKYYKLLVENFYSMQAGNNDKDRAYVAALSLCFDSEKVDTVTVDEICSDYVFDKSVSSRLGFVLTRNQLIQFCIRDLKLPTVSQKKIRNADIDDYKSRFGRLPLSYGQSEMWCTIAEWYDLLGLGRPPTLPKVLREFAATSGLTIPE